MKRIAALILLLVLACRGLTSAADAANTLRIVKLEASEHAVTLFWENTGAAAYAVYRSGSRCGIYRKLGTTERTTYKDPGLASGSIYYYKVRACRKDGTEWGNFSEPKGICSLKITEAPASQNPCWQQGKTIEVQGLMLHSLGCPQERAEAVVRSMNRPDAEVLVHAVVEPSGAVWQLADWELRAWHCGGAGNNTLIGIEMTEPNELRYLGGSCFAWSGDAAETAVQTYEAAVKLFASLCLQYDLDPLRDIVSHNEAGKQGTASGHADPEHLWKGLGLPLTMDTFRGDVQKMLLGRGSFRSAAITGHVVTVTAEVLNIRLGAGTDYPVRGELYRGERIAIETVVEREGHRWGRLTDGRWIALTYTSD